MGREKEVQIYKEQAKHDAAARDGQTCIYCNSVIPYGDEIFGYPGVCYACYGSVKSD